MNENNITFNDRKINKIIFYRTKRLVDMNYIDINKILISKKEAYRKKSSFKYIIGSNNNGYVRPLCIMLPQII